ncbi:NAD-dependent epimerase [Bacillus sp. H-16]|uniref:NAD-dependent epimerase n=1 Tax=Alteribacter salitolerans TaxID=2912333 RepID=UPI001963569F|nr:NAD-dependent epimerase [Alteribacter salitolerans]MBM7096296.1 NAD-dependent epimerase [Alteribacter salitolerans]
MAILVTGCAGFIGAHVVKRLTKEGYTVVGLDNVNSYYDPRLKQARLKWIKHPLFTFYKVALEDKKNMEDLFEKEKPGPVIHLAAQAGVRYSLENPDTYIQSNVTGFMNLLECCRHYPVEHLIFASTSSVYGLNKKMPFSTDDHTDHPASLYAATKKANEMMAHTYSHLFNIPSTGLRFFTVYGPWGRPDMALFTFTKNILEGKPIQIFNNGNMMRDFTYIDDIVEGIVRLLSNKPAGVNDSLDPPPSESSAPYKLYNIGNNTPVPLLDMIAALEKKLGISAKKKYLPLQPGDVKDTFADVSDLMAAIGFKPSTSIEQGVGKFVDWYKDYHNK